MGAGAFVSLKDLPRLSQKIHNLPGHGVHTNTM
jgi:hypothetical protein